MPVITHGETIGGIQSREYKAWAAMKSRALRKKDPRWHCYGGRGISISKRWLCSYEAFLKDMGRCPAGFTLERKDNNGDYRASNCVWASRLDQTNNRRVTKYAIFHGIILSLSEWARIFSVPYQRVRYRFLNGMDIISASESTGSASSDNGHSYGRKLRDVDIVRIRGMSKDGVRPSEIARRLGVTYSFIWRILSGRSWGHVK